MDDRSRVLTAACVGAVLGGLWGWLYLTASGGAIRRRTEAALDTFVDEVTTARATADKVRTSLTDARSVLGDITALRTRASTAAAVPADARGANEVEERNARA
jgi:hypothetical protein